MTNMYRMNMTIIRKMIFLFNMDFYGTKVGNNLVHPPAIAEEKRKFWGRIKEGASVKSSLVVPRPEKTNAQLGAIWGLMLTRAVLELEDRGYDTSFIYNLPEPTGIAISKDDLCKFFYNACPIYNEVGQNITLHKADIRQASKFFEDVRNWMASQWSITIPDPDKNWKET